MSDALPPQTPAVAHPEGLALKLRVTPGAKHDDICGTRAWGTQTRLVVRVRAGAQDGKANVAVVRALARWLELPAHDLRLVAGQRSRLKTVVAAGEPDALSRRLAQALDQL